MIKTKILIIEDAFDIAQLVKLHLSDICDKVEIANDGLQALVNDKHLLAGLNVHHGIVTNTAVADALGYQYIDPLAAIENSQLQQSA